MNVRWIVELSEAERAELEALISGGTLGARTMKRALILLRSADGWTDEQIAEALSCGPATVYRSRRRYVEAGLPDALHERRRPGAARKLDALQEATLVALACSDAPEGRAKWTMQLLADELVVLTDVDDISKETVRRRLAEKKLKPWQRKMWCIPAVDAEFVALDRRIASIDVLTAEVGAWNDARNACNAGIDWLFDVDDARGKLRKHYPVPTSRVAPQDTSTTSASPEAEPECDEAPSVEESSPSQDHPTGALARLWTELRSKLGRDAGAREAECA